VNVGKERWSLGRRLQRRLPRRSQRRGSRRLRRLGIGLPRVWVGQELGDLTSCPGWPRRGRWGRSIPGCAMRGGLVRLNGVLWSCCPAMTVVSEERRALRQRFEGARKDKNGACSDFLCGTPISVLLKAFKCKPLQLRPAANMFPESGL
jgi:hypothetical protein